jgi:hypothetical protein
MWGFFRATFPWRSRLNTSPDQIMKKLFACLALAFAAPILGSLYAQEGPPPEQYEPPPPVGMDVDYFPPPKQKLFIGISVLSGPKIRFSGSGSIPSGVNPGDTTDPTVTTRSFNDGTISPDARVGADGVTPITPDGRSNTFTFSNASQIDPNNNGVDFHTYSAVADSGANAHGGRAGPGGGYDITFERDFGWHLGRLQINLIGGLGLNKISFSKTSEVQGTLTTTTFVFGTFNTDVDGNGDPTPNPGLGSPTGYTPGAPATSSTPGAPFVTTPFSSPTSTTDPAGNPVDNSPLINNAATANPNTPTSGPAAGTTTSDALLTESANINGAYFTLRLGAEITLPITDKFSASVSGGPALVYAGTTFSVDQTVTPPTGNPITSTVSDTFNTVLPAYFANANVEYDLTDTTGLYLGAVFQSTTGYNQSINNPNGNYTTKIDFGNQEGVRMGVSFKF